MATRQWNRTCVPSLFLITGVITAVLALFASQGALAHCKGKHQPPHEHCESPPPGEDPKTFKFSITKASSPDFGFIDNDGNPFYIDGDDFVTAKQTAKFAELATGQNSPKKKVRKISVDLGVNVFLNGVPFEKTDPGELDALVVVGVDQATELNELPLGNSTQTSLFLRGHNFAEERNTVLVISFADPSTATTCMPALGMDNNGDTVKITRTGTIDPDGFNEWVVSPEMASACVFLFGDGTPMPQSIVMDDGFSIVITEL